MALIVELGSGLPNAESYISVADFKTYCDAKGLSYAGKTDLLIEQALRRATAWVDMNYTMKLCGFRVKTDQALALPMSGLVDWQGYYVAQDAVPRQVINSTAEAGFRELAAPGSLNPDVITGKIKKRAKVGSVEVEYAVGSADAASQTPIISVIDGIMASLMPRQHNRYSGKAVRG